jgi:heme/copper-type cytochrome/quinol oxidase subunit 4
MPFLIGFIICVAMALINLPFVLEGGDNWLNLASMIFCGALAVFQLVMAAVTINRY